MSAKADAARATLAAAGLDPTAVADGTVAESELTDALASQAFADGFRELPEERSNRGYFTDGIYASTPFLFDTGGRRAVIIDNLHHFAHRGARRNHVVDDQNLAFKRRTH